MIPNCEAALLSRLHWWTVEYGLIGNPADPKIYGAGLLSSVGESYNCLKEKVEKLAFDVDNIECSYDITEQQPQLFVAKDFRSLIKILDQISSSMAYKVGGIEGLDKAIQSKNVCTIELNSDIQISGKVSNAIRLKNSIIYIQLEGATQLSIKNKEIKNHGIEKHKEGFGAPLGRLNNGIEIDKLNKYEFIELGYKINTFVKIEFESGLLLEGIIKAIFEDNNYIKIITFSNCSVIYQDKVLFDPDWGEYDMICGQNIKSVFGGPSDIDQYFKLKDSNDEISNLNNNISQSNVNKNLDKIYSKIRNMREHNDIDFSILEKLLKDLNTNHANDWLASLEIYELAYKTDYSWIHNLRHILELKASQKTDLGQAIRKSLQLIEIIEV